MSANINATPALPGLLKRLWHHLAPARRRQFGLVLLLMLVSALAEAVSLGAIIPFLGVLTAPDRVLNHHAVAVLAQTIGVTTGDQLVLPLAIVFSVTAVIAGGLRLALLWFSTRLSFAAGADLSNEVYRRTLYQPYLTHVNRNSSEVVSGITDKVGGVVFGALLPGLVLISSLAMLVAIVLALLAIDAVIATVAAMCFGTIYAAITWSLRKRLRDNSHQIAIESTHVHKAIQEGLGGIRDVLLDGTQPVYSAIYRKADGRLRQAQSSNTFIAGGPRFAMESLGMVLIAMLAYVFSRQSGGVESVIPVLGAVALGAQRLLPVMQQGYAAWSGIVGSQASLVSALELLDQPLSDDQNLSPPSPLPFARAIRFESVSFKYGDEHHWVLEGVNLSIPKGSRVGFVGTTGSGKSTTLDLLMGLLEPTTGRIFVDDAAIVGSVRRAWQQTIAHVPQQVYLADTSFAENIAFGVPRDTIDINRVRAAARQAQIAEFIESRPQGYEAFVGERGIRLSGGQRQRIGIARALYKRASVLVFDEATSALDNATEQAVMESIENLDRQLTVLLIAHRISTVRHCDIIVELDRGKVVAQGTYEFLIDSSPGFRKLARDVV